MKRSLQLFFTLCLMIAGSSFTYAEVRLHSSSGGEVRPSPSGYNLFIPAPSNKAGIVKINLSRLDLTSTEKLTIINSGLLNDKLKSSPAAQTIILDLSTASSANLKGRIAVV